MRAKAYRKDIRRTITGSLGRFLAIFCMVALGAGVFAGLSASSNDMKLTGDKYYDDTNFMDTRLVCTYGFTENDISAIKAVEGVKSVMAGYFTDAMLRVADTDQVVRIHSLPTGVPSDSDAFINRPVLVAGRLPEKDDECVLSVSKLAPDAIKLGDCITLRTDDGKLSDTLCTDRFKVVGFVESSYYISFSYGSSSIGNGTINFFMYVPDTSFCVDYYTDVYATVDGADRFNCFTPEYDDVVNKVSDRFEALSHEREKTRYDEIMTSATDKLNDAQREYDDAKQEAEEKLNDAYVSLTDAQKQIDDSEKQIADGKEQLSSGWKQLNAKQRVFDEKKAEYESKVALYNSGKSAYEAAYSEYSSQLAAAEAGRSALDAAYAEYEVGLQAYNAAIAQGTDPAELAGQLAYLNATKAALDAKDVELKTAEEQLSAYGAELAKNKSQLDSSKALLDDAGKLLADGERQLKNARQTLVSSEKELKDGEKELEDAKIKLSDGWAEYYDAKEEADEKLNDAQQEITDARKKLSELKEPEWFVLDRDSNVGFVSFESDSNRMRSLSTVFPLIFFLVAALVALTTMTRMVDEERVLIGTYKALGYSSAKIMWRYLFYALIASISGSVAGILIMARVLPLVVWTAYRIMYIAPDLIWEYNIPLSLAAIFAATACTMLSTFFACKNVLSEQPSELMLPRAPKAGKRILLERIKPIWKHLSFNSKVTARNLFRYKKRLFMTLAGIAGCTALLITGFGIKDSISQIIENQYFKVYQFNTQVSVDKDLTAKTTVLADTGKFSDYILTAQKAAEIMTDDGTVSGFTVIPEDAERLNDYVVFRHRVGHESVPFGKGSVVVSEKCAKLLGVDVGDKVKIELSDGGYASFTLTGITENYVYQYLYIDPELYRSVTGEDIEWNTVLANCVVSDSAEREAISDKMLSTDGISTVSFIDDFSTKFYDMIKSLNYVTVILIVLAAVLAFVVLYNLTNINITERKKELATIKVLGFFDREVSSYIFRETIVLTLLGCIIGLVLGVFMHRLVITTVEVDLVMFGREIEPMSFVYSAALTILFSLIVDIVMKPKMNSIDMVDSLKSVD